MMVYPFLYFEKANSNLVSKAITSNCNTNCFLFTVNNAGVKLLTSFSLLCDCFFFNLEIVFCNKFNSS